MSEKRYFNIATSRPDASNPDKKHWTQHGILILSMNHQGEERISIKLNSFPIGSDFDGWFSAFPKEDDTRNATYRNNHHQSVANDDYDDSIPFN
jgi:hypothetical protein